jgi:hypothetical protein
MGGMGGMGHEVEIGHEVKIGHSYHSYLPTLVYMLTCPTLQPTN